MKSRYVIMPFQKKVQCLRDITNKVISIRIASFCVSTEMVVADDGSLGSLKSEKALSRMLLDLPGVLVDTLIYTAIKTLLEDEDRSQGLQEVDGTGPMSHVPGLLAALRLLPQETSSHLDLSQGLTKVI